jgi:hypothetical protein
MMDDLKYVFTVDDKDIIATIKNHEVLEKRVGSLTKQYAVLDKALNEGRIDLLDYAKAVQQLDKQIAHVEGTLKKGGSAVNQLATGMNVSGKAGRNMELQFQQAGYQIQDFIVQVQGGVNPLIAFSQQGSQLAGFFAGPWGAAIGLGIAALSSLAMIMLSTTEETTKTVDVFKQLTEATHQLWVEQMKLADSKFDENLVGTQDELKRLTEAYDAAVKKANELSLAQNYSGTAGTGAGVAILNLFAQASKDSADAAVKKAEADLDAYNIQKNLLLIAETQKTLDEQSAKQRLSNQDAYFEKLKAEAETRKKISEDVGKAYLDALKLGKVDSSSGIDKAAEAARILSERLHISLAAARDMVNLAANALPMTMAPSNPTGWAENSLGFVDPSKLVYTPPVSTSSGGGGGGIGGETQEQYLAKLNLEYETKKKSLGLTDEQVKRTEFLFSLDEKLATMKTKRSEVEIETEKQRAIAAYDAYAAAEKQAAIMSTVTSSLENMFMSFVDGTKSVGDAFKGMLRDIILQIYQEQVAKTAATGIGNFLSGLFTSANGNVFQGGSHVSAYANGGVVGSPTYFPMSGGKTGLMGEAGPEAIMPLKRGSNGKLGVQVDGNSGGSVVVNQTFNFSANGDESVKKIIAQAAPQIAQMTQQKIMDSRRRGGSMKAAFG